MVGDTEDHNCPGEGGHQGPEERTLEDTNPSLLRKSSTTFNDNYLFLEDR